MSEYNLVNAECLEYMKSMDENIIDLTVTSPPYDNLRTYNGNNSDWNSDKWKGILNTRKFLGIELDNKYFKIAEQRLKRGLYDCM